MLVGGVLEDRMRQLCAARGLAPTQAALAGYTTTLYKADAFDKPMLHVLNSIGALRNQAAHGGEDAAKVKREDVEDALVRVRRFLADHQP